MGTREELVALIDLCRTTGLRPLIDEVVPMKAASEALTRVGCGRRLRQDRVDPLARF